MAYLDGRLWPTWYAPQMRRPAFEVIGLVCRRFGYSKEDVLGPRRHANLMGPRAVITRILKDRGHSYPMIGRMLGGRDHSTIMHCLDNFDVYARRDERVQPIYQEMRYV